MARSAHMPRGSGLLKAKASLLITLSQRTANMVLTVCVSQGDNRILPPLAFFRKCRTLISGPARGAATTLAWTDLTISLFCLQLSTALRPFTMGFVLSILYFVTNYLTPADPIRAARALSH